MFSIAYVILPFSDVAPADAIRATLARFQRGSLGELPEAWLAFDDRTEVLRGLHEAPLSLADNDNDGPIKGHANPRHHLDMVKLRDEMRRLGSHTVRFADTIDLDTFVSRFARRMQRHPATGGYGYWDAPLGQWDWWDLGGRFDGRIIGERIPGWGPRVTAASSAQNAGRTILSNLDRIVRRLLEQAPEAPANGRRNRNTELAATLLADARAGHEHAYPAALVLPPGSVEEPLRWMDTAPLGPAETFVWLGLTPGADWPEVVEAAYLRFEDHWVVGIAYHS